MAATLVHAETLDLVARFPGSVTAESRPSYTGWIVNKDKLVEVATALRDEFGFDLLSYVVGVDYFPNTMEVVYEAFKTTGGPGIQFKVQVPHVDPIEIPSVTSIWPGAELSGTRDLGFIRNQVHQSSRPSTHFDVGRLRRPSDAERLA